MLTLVLGIGANAAVFQLIDAIALRPLQVSAPAKLVEVRIAGGRAGFGTGTGPYSELTRPVWYEIQSHQQAFSGVFAWGTRDFRIGDRSDLRRATGIAVSGDFFRVLGIEPYRGRLIEPSDETSCPASVAVVSYAYWQREMGGKPIDGNGQLRANLDLVNVVGVTPPGFLGLAVGDSFDIALPLCRPPQIRGEIFDIAVMGRLRGGWTVERASTHLQAISAGIFDSVAPTGYSGESIQRFKRFRLGAYPASVGVSALRTQYETSLHLLFVITAVILLIACANLTNLMLARGASRRREMAVRMAMGASRLALVRQLLGESCLLAGVGTFLAIPLAKVLGRVLLASIATSQSVPVLPMPTDWRVVLFATLLACGTCFLIGLMPAVTVSRMEPVALKTGDRGTTTPRGRLSFQRVIVVTQVAMSLVMLVAALLFVQSFRTLMTVDTGMRREGVSLAGFRFPESVPKERFDDFRRELLAHIRSVPEIASAGTTTRAPLGAASWGHDVRVGTEQASARFTWVSEGYFETMGIPVIKGRGLSLRDTRQSPRVAVVNEAFVRRFLGAAVPIGRTLQTGAEPGYPSTVYDIVGVIPDTAYNDVRGEILPMVFAPDSQHPSPGPNAQIVMYSRVPPAAVLSRIRQHVAQRYPDLISEYMNLDSRVQDILVRERLLAVVAGLFGVLAVVLTVVGVYGLLCYSVAQRRQEMGLRLALGARRSQIVVAVMAEGKLLLVGATVGGLVSVAVGGATSSLLFGVTPSDPKILAAAFLLLGVVTAIACYLPARRAAPHRSPSRCDASDIGAIFLREFMLTEVYDNQKLSKWIRKDAQIPSRMTASTRSRATFYIPTGQKSFRPKAIGCDFSGGSKPTIPRRCTPSIG